MRSASSTGTFSVTEKIKAELDAMELQQEVAQQDLENRQVISAGLLRQNQLFQQQLAQAQADREKALSNRNQGNQLLQQTKNMRQMAGATAEQSQLAATRSAEVSREMQLLETKLLYAIDLFNKMSNLTIRKKSLNPLISDELLIMMAKTGNDANEAMALTIAALRSACEAATANRCSHSAAASVVSCAGLVNRVVGGVQDAASGNDRQDVSLGAMYAENYAQAKDVFAQMEKTLHRSSIHSSMADSKLDLAKVKLQSLQAGLVAATAAASGLMPEEPRDQ